EHQRLAAAGAPPRPERVRAVLLHLLPLHLQAELLVELDQPPREPLLVAGEAVHVDERRRGRDEPVAVDLDRHQPRTCGRTCSPNRRICSRRSSPHSSSITCVQPASLYSSIAAMQSAGVPAIGLHLSRIVSVTFAFAASRPPCSIASAIGLISSCSSPARSRSVSAAPWMFCTLFARYMPAISRAPSRPSLRSRPIEATIVQPRSMSAGSRPAFRAPTSMFRRVYRTNSGVVIDGVSTPSPISPP